jgi:transcriptional regulator with XRE-family HTH domain
VRIKAARIAAGLTMRRLARLVGLTAATVSRYESGRRCASRKVLERLAGGWTRGCWRKCPGCPRKGGPHMTDCERFKLLFRLYKAPPLKRGDRAACLFRDTLVVVTSWTDARIPWPRCRALDSTGGGSGLLVDEELARAVRHESAAALMWWWRASARRMPLAEGAGRRAGGR